MAEPKKTRITPFIYMLVLILLPLIPGLSDLRGPFMGLAAGLAFSFLWPRYAVLVSAIAAAVGALAFRGDWYAFGVALLLALPLCIFLGNAFRKHIRPEALLSAGVLIETAALGGTLALASRRAGFNVWERFFDQMGETLSVAMDEVLSAGTLPENADPAQITEMLSAAVDVYRSRMPYFLLTAATVLMLLFYFALLGLRRSYGEKNSPLPPFRYFRMSGPLTAVIGCSLIGRLFFEGTLGVALENLYTFLTMLAVVAGLAYGAYWLKQKGFPTAARGALLTVAAVLALLIPLIWFFFLIIGLTDAIWNLRAAQFRKRKE